MQYGFLIDHRRCIGCHACTVACKSENEVPVGNFRTWVKYVESGKFPEVKRSFGVLRCNHCTNAPCVTICPVTALDKRKDGIVDIDKDACIGCRACMQACPYDAIHLNEDSGNVEKCHYCAHRIEVGLEPACVVVCPEQAIVPGDLHDPGSKIARMTKEFATEVRRPEQNTGPNVHYLGHDPDILRPGVAERPSMYLWSDRPPHKPEAWPTRDDVAPKNHTRVVLDAGHRVEWGFAVALYLVTKGVAAGAALLAPFLAALGVGGFAQAYLPELLALAFTGITTFLLVEDLTRPLKFLTLLTRPNTKSWLVRGAWILIGFSALTTAILGLRWLGQDQLADTLRWVNLPFAALAAAYTAFLFKQCEGRDLWQGSLLLPQLLGQAIFLGALAFVPFAGTLSTLAWVGWCGFFVHTMVALLEWKLPHRSANARQAAGFLGRVRLWSLPAFAVGLALVFAAQLGAHFVPPIAFVLAFLGLLFHEHAFVRAGQLPPLS